MHTFGSILDRHGITVPDETIAELTVPVLDTVQRQGDVLVCPRGRLSVAEREACQVVPAAGVPVVVGEATGNTHLLHGEGEVRFGRRSAGLVLGVVEVPEGSTAYLIHTDEHGATGIGPGCYELRGKREQAEEIRRVAD